MIKKIEKLTAEQESMLTVYANKWMDIGLCTKPADRPRAESALIKIYQSVDLEPPKQIIWVSSPMAGSLVISIMKNEEIMNKILSLAANKVAALDLGAPVLDSVKRSMRDSVAESVWDSVAPFVRDSVYESVRDSVAESVWDSVRDSVWTAVDASVRFSVEASMRVTVAESVWDVLAEGVLASMRDSVLASVMASVMDSVGHSVRDSVMNSVERAVWESVHDSVAESVLYFVDASMRVTLGEAISGQHNAGYCCFIEYFRDVVGLIKETEKMVSYIELAKCANWFFPYKNIAFISDKPDLVKLKDGKIHSENGPAIRYRDGFEVYGLDGVRIPKEIFTLINNKEKPKEILKIENAEHRLLAIKYFGMENLFSKLKSKLLNKKGSEYELFSVEIDGSKEIVLKMKNPSENKFHFEFVPPEIKTVDEALAWRIGWDSFSEPKFKA